MSCQRSSEPHSDLCCSIRHLIAHLLNDFIKIDRIKETEGILLSLILHRVPKRHYEQVKYHYDFKLKLPEIIPVLREMQNWKKGSVSREERTRARSRTAERMGSCHRSKDAMSKSPGNAKPTEEAGLFVSLRDRG